MARKNILKLTESQLMDVITESVRRVLSESVDEFGFSFGKNKKRGDAFAVYDKKGVKIERGMKVQFTNWFKASQEYGYVESTNFDQGGHPYVVIRTNNDVVEANPEDCVIIS